MKNKIIWYGDSGKINSIQEELPNTIIKYIATSSELNKFLNSEEDNLIFVMDIKDLNEEEIKIFSKPLLNNQQGRRMAFFIDKSESFDFSQIPEMKHLFFLYRYDLFALRGLINKIELGPVAYIRKNPRAPKNQTFKFKLFNSTEWRRGLIADLSKTGMGARVLDVKECEKLKLAERMLVRFKDINGQIITKWAEVRWLKNSPYSYTAGLKFSS